MVIAPRDPCAAYGWNFNGNGYTRAGILAGQHLYQKVNGNGLMDYNITYQTGTVTIIPAVVTITVDSKTMTYGDSLPNFTARYSGLVGNDLITVVTGGVSIDAYTDYTTATSMSHAGTYTIGTAFASQSADYTVVFNMGVLTINPATIYVSPNDQTVVYGAEMLTDLTGCTYKGVISTDDPSVVLTGVTLGTTDGTTQHHVGKYIIYVATATSTSDYVIKTSTSYLEVVKAKLTFTAADQTLAYGQSLDQNAYTISGDGLASWDSLKDLGLVPTLSTTGVHVGTYAIAITGTKSTSDYTVSSYVAGSVTINAAPLTIAADNKTKSYGDALPTWTYTVTGLMYKESLLTSPSFSTTATATSHVGSYVINIGGASASSDYTISYQTGTLDVTAAVVTVSADNKTKVYGAAMPSLTYTVTGLVNGDTLSAAPTLSTTATAASHAGAYAISVQGAGIASSDYTVKCVDGTLTVTPAILTIATFDQSKIYGNANPDMTGDYRVSGYVNGDTSLAGIGITSVIVAAPSITVKTGVGVYLDAVTATWVGSAKDYQVVVAAGTFTVTRRSLTITADNETKVYGDANPDLTGDFTTSGLVNGDTLAGIGVTVAVAAPSITAATEVGHYAYAVTASYTGTAANYDVTAMAGDFDVTKRTLTVAADDQTKVYGNANPALTYSVDGLVNGDTLASIGVTVVLASPSITKTTDVGSYADAIAVTYVGSPANYDVAAIAGTFVVTQRALIITANDQSKTYGDANPDLTGDYTTSGLVNGDTLASIGVTVALAAPSITTRTDAGVYADAVVVTYSGTAANYAIGTVAGDFIVAKRVLTITANDQTKTYGDANPTLTYGTSGLVNGDTLASIGVTVTLASSITETTGAGVYVDAITVAYAGTAANYSVATVAGAFYVAKRSLTVTANDQSKTYGDANPDLTGDYTTSGLVNGDTLASIGATVSLAAPSITEATGAGEYAGAIAVSCLGSPANYDVATVAGKFVIAKRTLTISADDQTKVYGDANPTLTYGTSGLVNGDTLASIGAAVDVAASSITAFTGVGFYADAIVVTCTGAPANYELATASGDFTVTKRSLTVKANNQSKTYGDANPALTYAVAGLVNGDTLSKIGVTVSLSTPATALSNAGSYVITVVGAGSPGNYSVSYVNGVLTIDKRELEFTGNAVSETYGATWALASLATLGVGYTVQATGIALTSLPSGLAVSVASVEDADGHSVANAVAAGAGTYTVTYAITGTATSYDYADPTFTGVLTITPAALTVTANSVSKAYGDSMPVLGFTANGLVNGDTVALLAALGWTPALATTATADSAVGAYGITFSEAPTS
jgi:hypothetical protein